jgi:hypothetical protein
MVRGTGRSSGGDVGMVHRGYGYSKSGMGCVFCVKSQWHTIENPYLTDLYTTLLQV